MTEGFEAELSGPLPPFLPPLPHWFERDIEVDPAPTVIPHVLEEDDATEDEPELERDDEPQDEFEEEYRLVIRQIIEEEQQYQSELEGEFRRDLERSRQRQRAASILSAQLDAEDPQLDVEDSQEDIADPTFQPLLTSLFPRREHTPEELIKLRREVERRRKRLSMVLQKDGSIFQESRLYCIYVFEWVELQGEWFFVMSYRWPDNLDSRGPLIRQGGYMAHRRDEFAYRQPSYPEFGRSDCVCWVITDMLGVRPEFTHYANPGVIMELRVLGEEMGDEMWEQPYFWEETRRRLRKVIRERDEQEQEEEQEQDT